MVVKRSMMRGKVCESLEAKAFTVILSILLFSVILLSGGVSAWDASVSYSTDGKIAPGGDVTFIITVKNTGLYRMKVTYVGIHFDWMNSGQFAECNSNLPQIIESGKSYQFKVSVHIPQEVSLGKHTMVIRIKASSPAVVAWGPESSRDFPFQITVEKPLYAWFYILIFLMILAIILGVGLQLRKPKKEKPAKEIEKDVNEASMENKETPNDIADKLRKLKQLYEERLITEEEYNSKKKELLDEL